MTFAELQESIIRETAPPEGASPVVQALWHDARGDWKRAHECVQDDTSREGSWVHAYLHRKEGDLGNARYWFAQAGRPARSPPAPAAPAARRACGSPRSLHA